LPSAKVARGAGKIPGGFFKREGRPTDRETLTSRLIDRPIRPLFPKGFTSETQVIATVISVDGRHDSSILALTGASAALMISDIPFSGPIAGIRVGRIDGKLVSNPHQDEMENSDLDIVMACSREAVVMVEGGAHELPEDVILEALDFGHRAAQPLLEAQEEMARQVGREKRTVVAPQLDERVMAAVVEEYGSRFTEALADKLERRDYLSNLKAEIAAQLESQDIPVDDLGEVFEKQLSAVIGSRFSSRKSASAAVLSMRFGRYPVKWGCCPGCMDQRCLPGVKPRPW